MTNLLNNLLYIFRRSDGRSRGESNPYNDSSTSTSLKKQKSSKDSSSKSHKSRNVLLFEIFFF